MEMRLSEVEKQTGRRYSSEAERRLLAWARTELPRAEAVERGELPGDPEQVFLRDLDGRQYGPTTAAALEAQLQDIQAELGD